MTQHLRPAIAALILFTLLLGLAYPLSVTAIAQLAFPERADGSLIRQGDRVVGSSLVGQGFSRPEYLRPRPSAAGDGYDASASSGSNLGPLNPDLASRVAEQANAIRADAADGAVPADAVTASASGLDPDISPAYARLQLARIAAARGTPLAKVEEIVTKSIKWPLLGFVGQPRVNVLETNLALDARFPVRQPATP